LETNFFPLYLNSVAVDHSVYLFPKQFRHQNPLNHRLIPAGTDIPVKYEQGEKILLTKQETFSLSLTVTDNIKNSQGQTIIPDGSQIIGEIKPDGQGSRFLSQKIFLKTRQPQEKSIMLFRQFSLV